MHGDQRGTSSLRNSKRFNNTPSVDSINMDLGCSSDYFSCQYFNSCCKGDNSSGNMMFSTCSHVILLDSLI